jgi:hypothetical protein
MRAGPEGANVTAERPLREVIEALRRETESSSTTPLTGPCPECGRSWARVDEEEVLRLEVTVRDGGNILAVEQSEIASESCESAPSRPRKGARIIPKRFRAGDKIRAAEVAGEENEQIQGGGSSVVPVASEVPTVEYARWEWMAEYLDRPLIATGHGNATLLVRGDDGYYSELFLIFGDRA